MLRFDSSQLDDCPVCGYSLRGLPSRHSCPECGLQYDEHTAIWERQPAALKAPTLISGTVFLILAPCVIAPLFASIDRLFGRWGSLGLSAILLSIAAPVYWYRSRLDQRPPLMILTHAGFYFRPTFGRTEHVAWSDYSGLFEGAGLLLLDRRAGPAIPVSGFFETDAEVARFRDLVQAAHSRFLKANAIPG